MEGGTTERGGEGEINQGILQVHSMTNLSMRLC